jgi:hypothetical protein
MADHLAFLAVLALAACHAEPAPAGPAPSGATVPRGEWSLMHFLGGPPMAGQITDTLRFDPGTGTHHVRIERNRAGAPRDQSCELDPPGDTAWTDLVAALADATLQDAWSHPEHIPLLTMDAGYFACTHAGVRIALSDMQAAPPATAHDDAASAVGALSRLRDAHEKALAEWEALPACRGL